MDAINSFFSNIKDKLTNPFFGTLILVLVIHHWQLWYAILNFDEDFTLVDKLTFIKKYILINLTFSSFIWDICQAIFFMFLGYLVIVATRSLVLWIEFSLMPLITKKIVSKNVVRKSEYDDVVKEREQYFDQYEEQRKNVRTFSRTIDEQTEQIKQKDQDLLNQSETISITVRELDITKQKLEKAQKENDEKSNKITQLNSSLEQLQKNYDFKLEALEKYQNLFFDEENRPFYTSIEKFPPEIVNKVNELKAEKKWERFLSLGNFFEHGGSIGGQVLTEMIEKEVAFERGSHEDLTPVGRIIWRYRKIFGAEI
ncbi:hypothetical protein [Flavobacterium sedimenticola]|uniref:Uncharacterized protein n=1 Tax=Flavobacterium sedimenticola TaxID=3043286 RepID=A0ABT6XPF9_9FLAO|nr:hypothetical protein [Flavobacterium sedimenticola]MDI9256867.1 hypothetical protein [Flavobacterium sedimenticola]